MFSPSNVKVQLGNLTKKMLGYTVAECMEELEGDFSSYSESEEEIIPKPIKSHKKKIIKKEKITKIRIHTKFNELPPEILLNIIDFIIPFFSHLDVLLTGYSLDVDNKRLSIKLLENTMQSMQRKGVFSEVEKELKSTHPTMPSKNRYKYFGNMQACNHYSLALCLRKYMGQVTNEIYNWICINRKSFYAILVEDCYDLLAVKLFWEFLFQFLKNTPTVTLVLANREDCKLPASQYVLDVPLYQAVLRARQEPIYLCEMFLGAYDLGLKTFLVMTQKPEYEKVRYLNTYAVSMVDLDTWREFVIFLKKQVKNDSLMKTSKHYNRIINAAILDVFHRLQPLNDIGHKKFEFLVTNLLVDLEIPIVYGTDTFSKLFMAVASLNEVLFKRLIKLNINRSQGLEEKSIKHRMDLIMIENHQELVHSLVQSFKFDVLDYVLDYTKNNALEMNCEKLAGVFTPVSVMIERIYEQIETLSTRKDFTSLILKCAAYMIKLRRFYLDISHHTLDVLKSSALYQLLFNLNAILSGQPSHVAAWKVFKAFYTNIISEKDAIDILKSPCRYEQHMMFFVGKNEEIIRYVFSKEHPKEILQVCSALLLTPADGSKPIQMYYSVFHSELIHLDDFYLTATSATVLLSRIRLLKSYTDEVVFEKFKYIIRDYAIRILDRNNNRDNSAVRKEFYKLFRDWNIE